MRPLIDYYETVTDAIVSKVKKVNRKYIGKLSFIIVPVLLWTIYWATLEFIYNLSKRINESGGDLLERFMKND